MCGIAGFKTNRPEIDHENILANMLQAIFHRGPDSAGKFMDGGYFGGMRRLSINDLETGDQPLYNEDKSVVLFYNGEIYNYHELKAELEAKGCKFKSRSDGEVICHLYQFEKEKLFERLDGMFAVALWDRKSKKLILARDIPGEKPLYFSRLSHNEIVFGSEIKALIKHPRVSRDLNHQAIWDFPTFLWVPEPSTAFTSVEALMPGHFLSLDEGGIKIQRYANRFGKDSPVFTNEQEAIDATREVITHAVESRLLSDVPVGSFLSSGLDSSIIATLAAKKRKDLHTFTIGFENLDDPYHGKADEAGYASEYAAKLGTKHHVIRVTANDFKNALPSFCRFGDQPFSVSSGLGILFVAKAAREQGIKVLLSGDGADECFGGYSWYQNLFEGFPASGEADASSVSFQSFGLPVEERLKQMQKYSSAKRAWAWHYYASESEKQELFGDRMKSEVDSSLRYFSKYRSDNAWTREDYIRQDRQFYFPNEMLRKVDRMTMAHSVEGRAPFAAPEVLRHAERLKYSHCVHSDGTLKWVLRRAFADILPQSVSTRPKHGFNVPIDHWLKNEWSDMLKQAFSPDSALCREGFLAKDAYQKSQEMLYDKQKLNGHTLFSFLMLNLWLQENV